MFISKLAQYGMYCVSPSWVIPYRLEQSWSLKLVSGMRASEGGDVSVDVSVEVGFVESGQPNSRQNRGKIEVLFFI